MTVERMRKKEKVMETTQEQTQTNRHQMKKMTKKMNEKKKKKKKRKHRGKQQKSNTMHNAPSDKDETQEKEIAMKAMRQLMMIVLSHLASVEVEMKRRRKCRGKSQRK